MKDKNKRESAPQGDVAGKTTGKLILPPPNWEKFAVEYESSHRGLSFDSKLKTKGCWLLYDGKKLHPYFENYMAIPFIQHLKLEVKGEGYAQGQERLIPLILRDLNEAYWKIVQPIAWDEVEDVGAPLPLVDSHERLIVNAKVFRELSVERRPCIHILFSLATPYLKPLAADLSDRIAKSAVKPKGGLVVSIETRPIGNKAELLAFLMGEHEDRLIVDCHPGRLLLDDLEISTLFFEEWGPLTTASETTR